MCYEYRREKIEKDKKPQMVLVTQGPQIKAKQKKAAMMGKKIQTAVPSLAR